MMLRDIAEKVLVKALLGLAILMVNLFNAMDDGPVNYRVTEDLEEPPEEL